MRSWKAQMRRSGTPGPQGFRVLIVLIPIAVTIVCANKDKAYQHDMYLHTIDPSHNYRVQYRFAQDYC